MRSLLTGRVAREVVSCTLSIFADRNVLVSSGCGHGDFGHCSGSESDRSTGHHCGLGSGYEDQGKDDNLENHRE